MAAKQLIEWIRREHAKVQELANELRRAIAVVPRTQDEHWLSKLREGFDKFRAHMVQHIALARCEGYLAPVTEHRPLLHPEIQRLEQEHNEIVWIMDCIHRDLHTLPPAHLLGARDCSRRIEHLLEEIDHHEERENNLVIYAFTQDIGTED